MKIALIGNQNCGKTTLFNLLTGSNQKVGNWPGVTIEKKSGIIKGSNNELIDLPGVYSLSPYSPEEEVSRNFIFSEQPELIINIIDVTSLERSLYLTTQLLELDCPIIIVLNMNDLLEKKGLALEEKKLSESLSCSVVTISALKKTGINELLNLINNKQYLNNYHIRIFPDEIEKLIDDIKINFINHKRFQAIKFIEKDTKIELDNETINLNLKELEKEYKTDSEQIIATLRYHYIEQLRNSCIKNSENKNSYSEKIDKILLNKYIALPIFFLIMALIYFCTIYLVGNSTSQIIEKGIHSFSLYLTDSLTSLKISTWTLSLLTDGLITGVGAVLIFIPQLITLFLLLSLLETTGYMSRVTFMMDKFFNRFGLNGKSLVPFLVGSGCSVPGIMSSKTIEDNNERELTIILVPFIPCNAKLPLIALFSSYFFIRANWIVAVSLYFLAILIILISAIIIKKLFYKNKMSTYIFELPEYKIPSIRYLTRDVFDKTIDFIKRAGTVIIICSLLVWFLASFTIDFRYIEGNILTIESSILAQLGKGISWLFYPILGENNWAASVSALQGLIAKEQVVSSMAVLNGLASDASSNDIFASGGLFANFTPLSGYAFLIFNLFSAPCVNAIVAMKKELKSKRKTFYAIIFQYTLAWTLASFTFFIGNLF